MTTDTDIKNLAMALAAHGRTLDRLPPRRDVVRVLPLGSGGVMLSRGAVEILIGLFAGEGDIVLTDRDWLRAQLRRRGMGGAEVDMLIDHISPPLALATILPFPTAPRA